jgi:hypothetical protein
MAATGINEIEYAAIREVLPHEAVEVIHALDDRLTAYASRSRGDNLAFEAEREALTQAQNHREQVVQSYARVGLVPDEATRAADDENIARIKAKADKHLARATESLNVTGSIRELYLERTIPTLREIVRKRWKTRLVRTGVPKGDPAAIVARQREETASLGKDRHAVTHAGSTLAEDEAAITAQLQALKTQGDKSPLVSVFERKPRLEFDVVAVNSPLHGGEFPVAPNPWPLLVSLNYEAILERVLKQVRDRHQRDTGLKLTSAERTKLLAEIREKIVAAERIEAAAIWAAAANGIDIPFRANTSISALLGIEIIKA